MSGRIRSIKPELLEDAVTAGLSDIAFRLFVACILFADDHGYLRFEPAWIRGQVYWARDVELHAFTAALEELEPLIEAYVVKGQRYGAIRGWKKHQRVDKPGKPRCPPPPESVARPSRESPEDLAPDLRSPIPDHDHERDLPRARSRVADAPEEPEPIVHRDVKPPNTPPPLDAPIPPELAERAKGIIQRTGVVDVELEATWRKYVAWLNERDFEQPVTEARWARWVEDECSKAANVRRRAHEREWSGPRLVAGGGSSGNGQIPMYPPAPPYHRPYVAPTDDEPSAPREVALEAARRLVGAVS